MNYPIWELTTLGGGTLIALIAILHVYISHLAVGGGLFLWLTDRKAAKEKNEALKLYVKKHTWFFLLLTMVFGGMSGVGIWFIIALVGPAATSSLIHNYVFGWAIEWVFFVGEIVALLVYHYKFDDLKEKDRLNVAFLYFLFAWLSLVIINGILTFMLTPGTWIESHEFWEGFFNPTYFPSLFFRSFIAAMFAGIFGYITAVYTQDDEMRVKLMKYCSKWVLYPIPGLVLSGLWYYYAIPGNILYSTFGLNPQTSLFVYIIIIVLALITVLGVFLTQKSGAALQKVFVYLVVLAGLIWMGSFEYIREIARKPYIIYDYMYSTSILKAQEETLNNYGILPEAKWTAIHGATPENRMEAGRELFNLQCLSCHTLNGFRNDVIKKSQNFTYLGMMAMLTGQGKVNKYMPPFIGTEAEKSALAYYLSAAMVEEKTETEKAIQIAEIDEPIPEFDKKKDDYVLLAWNDLGMHCISDSDPWFVILPPANTLEAILIRRDESPEQVADGVEITYEVEPGYENPAKHVDFWKFAKQNFGAELEENIGLFGKGMSGSMDYDEEMGTFIARGIPVVPYKDDGSYNPYPLFTITAKDVESGEILMQTKVVAPTSTEMGCKNCHGGEWRVNNYSGMGDVTAQNILQSHDQLNGTDLLSDARNGNPKLCQSCHKDSALGAEGKPDVLNLSAAMHGWHANYMPFDDARACVLCHPAPKKGNTRCNRGFHSILGVTCVNCHGSMQEHALALLKAESDKPVARNVMSRLKPTQVESVDEINPRKPWEQEPDCLTCHEDFEAPEVNPSGYNVWNEDMSELFRMRTGDGDIRCQACHSSTHALYPANNPYGKNRDNMQPMQYADQPFPIGANLTCETCHRVKMEDAIHHDNMEHIFRNKDLIK